MKQQYAHLGALLCLALLAIARTSTAQVVVDNGAPSTVQAYDMTFFSAADDFITTSPITFNTIHFWALDDALGINASIFNFSGTLSWYLYNDSGSYYPGSALTSGSVSSGISIVPTGTAITTSTTTFPIFELTFSIPSTTLPTPGKYWLRLKDGADGTAPAGSDPSVYWLESVNSPLVGVGSASSDSPINPSGAYDPGTNPLGWGFNARDSAFQLVNAPEPGTLALFFCAASATALRSRRACKR
jgi:hypothetical protein